MDPFKESLNPKASEAQATLMRVRPWLSGAALRGLQRSLQARRLLRGRGFLKGILKGIHKGSIWVQGLGFRV